MNIGLAAFEDIQLVREKILAVMGLQSEKRVGARAHFNMTHALNEVTRGLARLFPHKKSFAYVKGMDSRIEALLPFFSMEGYQPTALKISDLKSKETVGQLRPDTLFLVISEDDPFHGGLFEVSSEFLAELSAKKIFVIRVSNRAYLSHSGRRPESYEALVLAGAEGYAFSLLGDRCQKMESVLFGPCGFFEDAIQSLESLKRDWSVDLAEIEKLEKDPRLHAKAPLLGRSRVADRAVLVWEDLDSYALLQVLSENRGEVLKPPGLNPQIESGSLCRWGGIHTLDWLQEQGWSAAQIQGSLVVDVKAIGETLIQDLVAARAAVLKLQKG